jgi:two-component system, OmpR family, sensor histidine kinase CiaH
VRLLTLAVPTEDGAASAVRTLEAGFVLTLHDEQSDTLLRSILIVGLGGLLGAAVVTLLLTRRALVPVRAAFARERRFVAAASHELRTPIALIRGSAEVLGRERKVRPAGEALVADIVAEADRLGGLVSDLSDLAVAQARPPASRVPVDLGTIASDVARRAQPLAESRGVFLEAQEPASVVVRGDRDRLFQLALILIDNAIRHSPAGGTVRVAVARVHGHGELSVADEGPGIPLSERERIFEPFARVAPSAAEKRGSPPGAGPSDGGSGLGLAIARSLVTGMGGDIRVDGAAREGATFTISLPGV